ncbi:MAG: hypothetical protein WD382_10495 [Halofilum sp. (in: g-proteobacteria)]
MSLLGPPVASVAAPLPAALVMALINLEPQTVLTTLAMLSFPMTLLTGVLYMIGRSVGLVGWGCALIAGILAGLFMMNIHGMQPPPPSVEAIRADVAMEPVGPFGAVLQFILPGMITSATFWLALRLQSPRVFID